LPFRTPLLPSPAAFDIRHDHRLLLLGSCFTEHIGQKLADRKFRCLINPFGIVYNPISMAHCLERVAIGSQNFSDADLFENAGLWHSWEHHGRFSHPDPVVALQAINEMYDAAVSWLKDSPFLLLTFGTADVFFLRETGQIVANNHKMPDSKFYSRRLSVAEIVDTTVAALQKSEKVARQSSEPPFQVILSVSPVRHLRMGLVENQRSKAALILACDEICRALPFVHYFPAYELLMDDLRDYRFYGADMVHPSEVAIDYVWDFFCETCFSRATRLLTEQIEKIRASARHRPFHPDTAQHRAFVSSQLEAIARLKASHPSLDFATEEARFKAG